MRRFLARNARTVVVAVIAAVVASVATAGAASLITGKQIKDGTITQKDLAKSVRAQLAKAGLPGQAGAPGPAGAPGAKGDRGEKGDPGVNGATNIVVRSVSPCPSLPVNVHCSMPIQCHAGERAISGGAGFDDFSGNEVVNVSEPITTGGLAKEGQTPTGWFSSIEFTSGVATRNPTGFVVCASP